MRYKKLSVFISILIFLFSVRLAWSVQNIASYCLVIISLCAIYFATQLYKKPFAQKVLVISMIFQVILFIYLQVFVAALLIGLLTVATWLVFRKKQLQFNVLGYQLFSFHNSRRVWRQIAYVILKDDVITIIETNKKMLQVLVSTNFTAQDVKAFNKFCEEHIKAARHTA